MKILFGNGLTTACATAWLGMSAASPAATMMVDWLTLGSGATPAAFSLVGDNSLAVATGSLVVNAGAAAFLQSPSTTLNAVYWSAASDFTDTAGMDARVMATGFRVVPNNGSASYQIRLAVPADQELVLAIGGLYRSGASGTQAVGVSALTDGGGGEVTLHQVLGWNNGVTVYNQDVEWNETTDTLASTIGSTGESEFAFVRVAPLSGTNARVVLSVPNGYASGTGDTINVALGVLLPEPGVLTLAGLGGLVLLRRRR